MNEVGVSFQALFSAWNNIWPGLVWIISNVFMLIIVFFVGVKYSDYIWKSNIKFHMPTITKNEITVKDDKIKVLQEENEKYKIENGRLSSHADAIIKVAQVMDEVKDKEKK